MPRLPEADCFWQSKTVAVRSRQLPVMKHHPLDCRKSLSTMPGARVDTDAWLIMTICIRGDPMPLAIKPSEKCLTRERPWLRPNRDRQNLTPDLPSANIGPTAKDAA